MPMLMGDKSRISNDPIIISIIPSTIEILFVAECILFTSSALTWGTNSDMKINGNPTPRVKPNINSNLEEKLSTSKRVFHDKIKKPAAQGAAINVNNNPSMKL